MPTFIMDNNLKIWFSKPNRAPLGPLNEFRLSLHRIRFPDDELTLVSNLEDFSVDKQTHIKEFCARWKIKLVSLKDVEAQLETLDVNDKKEQFELLRIARLETTLEYGNLAAASDIVRLLSPFSGMLYSDLDMIKQKSAVNSFEAPFGLLLDGDFFVADGGVKSELLCNSSFICDESTTSFLRDYRKLVLDRYNNIEKTVQYLHQEKKCFDLKEYKAAIQSMKEHRKREEELGIPKALRFRAALKRVCTPANYERAYKALIEEISGPGCMDDAFNLFIDKEFIPKCKANKLFGEKFNLAWIKLRLKCPFTNQTDLSWVDSSSQSQKNWHTLESRVAKLQYLYRKYRKHNAGKEAPNLKQPVPEEERKLDVPSGQP